MHFNVFVFRCGKSAIFALGMIQSRLPHENLILIKTLSSYLNI
uniref:Uncharacterized protein n=1 Tax=Arundo donax TaxID=35708 RepID=A0A0A8YZW1_ARUDO